MPELRDMKLTETHIVKEGGEGTIYSIPGNPLLAKVYHPEVRTDLREKKIERMVELKVTGDMAGSIAWPCDAITENGKAIGFTMPKLDALPLGSLLSNDECFNFDWLTRLKIVRNIAATVAVLHAHGIVVGDLHAENFGFRADGGTVLYDADSLQIRDGRRLFPCTVCHDDCRPPEISHIDLSAKPSLGEETDSYMLGHLVFRVLLGSHPFPGVPTSGIASSVSGSTSNAMMVGDFTYGQDKPSYGAPIETAGNLKLLFECCFADGAKNPSARPSALEWVQEIDKLAAERMAHCGKHGSYPARMGSCPFCKATPPTDRRPAGARAAIAQVPARSPVAGNVAAAAAAPAQPAGGTGVGGIDAVEIGWIIAKAVGAIVLVVAGVAALTYLLPYILMGAIFIGLIASLD